MSHQQAGKIKNENYSYYIITVSYRLMFCPPWIKDGGYWNNPDDYTLVGVASDPNEYYIPDTVTKLTLAELQTRQLAIHAKYPMREPLADEDMTNAEVETMIDNWWEKVK